MTANIGDREVKYTSCLTDGQLTVTILKGEEKIGLKNVFMSFDAFERQLNNLSLEKRKSLIITQTSRV